MSRNYGITYNNDMPGLDWIPQFVSLDEMIQNDQPELMGCKSYIPKDYVRHGEQP